MSATWPTRPSGISASAASVNAGDADAISGVSTSPGITALTRIPRDPSSSEAERVRPRSAHFEAVYAAAAWPDMAATEQMLTIDEPAGISGTSAWMPSIGPVTLMAKVRSQVSSVTSGSRSRAATPALLTSASTAAVLALDPGRQLRPRRRIRDVEMPAPEGQHVGRDHRRARGPQGVDLGRTLAAGRAGDDDDLVC